MAISHTEQILDFLRRFPGSSSKTIHEGLGLEPSYATLKRYLAKMIADKRLVTTGKGRATLYSIAATHGLLQPISMEKYFEEEIDQRNIISSFNFSLLREILPVADLFTIEEYKMLAALQDEFQQNTLQLTPELYAKEMERLAIDLSWKSSQIEGNTYSLLETERLLTEKETAAGKPKDDAVMLLNHKEAINFLLAHKDYAAPLTIRAIEDIHAILIKELNIDRNIRQRRVGISGTNYRPLDNAWQIEEAMQDMCRLVNSSQNIFEKALLALALLSYIQPFNDGNKRTARIICNAVLLAAGYCPLSFRTVDSVEYKKAMLIFYEQNNIYAIKRMFIDQYAFAVKTYF